MNWKDKDMIDAYNAGANSCTKTAERWLEELKKKEAMRK
jgi:hypothetical protein